MDAIHTTVWGELCLTGGKHVSSCFFAQFTTVWIFFWTRCPGYATRISPPPGLELVPSCHSTLCLSQLMAMPFSYSGLNSVWDRQLCSLRHCIRYNQMKMLIWCIFQIQALSSLRVQFSSLMVNWIINIQPYLHERGLLPLKIPVRSFSNGCFYPWISTRL